MKKVFIIFFSIFLIFFLIQLFTGLGASRGVRPSDIPTPALTEALRGFFVGTESQFKEKFIGMSFQDLVKTFGEGLESFDGVEYHTRTIATASLGKSYYAYFTIENGVVVRVELELSTYTPTNQ